MSIEVRQLVIKSTVGEEAEPSRGAAPALSREQLARVKAELLAEGVMPADIDLAMPLLLGKDHVFDLANGTSVDAGEIVRKILENRIQERVYGPSHPRVASALNALGAAALGKGALDEAQADFTRMAAIYRTVYGDKHYLLGVAASDLGSVATKRGDQKEAERLFREAVQRFTAAQSPTHLNTGVARIKLGRVLLAERRFSEAEQESLAGYGIIEKQASPAFAWLNNARSDLAIEYDSLHMPDQAAKFRAALAAAPTHMGPPAAR